MFADKLYFKLALLLILTISLTLGLSVSLQSVLASWTNPTAAPPGNNVPRPINVSAPAVTQGIEGYLNVAASTTQTTSGGLAVAGLFIVDTDGLVVKGTFPYNVGIGTTNPGAKLDVNGSLKITDGSQGAGKVLMSDASGLASWVATSTLGLGGGGGGGQTVMLNGGVQKVNISAPAAFTSVNISANTGADTAKFAILNVNMAIDVRMDGWTFATTTARFRAGGSAATSNLPEASLAFGHGHAGSGFRTNDTRMVIVPLDSNETFEYDFNTYITGGIIYSNALKITLVGYIKDGGSGGGGGIYRTAISSAATSCATKCGGLDKCIISQAESPYEAYPLRCEWTNAAYTSSCICSSGSGGGGEQLLASDGYTKIGGLIIQWGTGTAGATSGSVSSHTFPIAFPTTCVNIQTNFNGASVGGNSDVVISSKTATGFNTIRQNNGNFDSFTNFNWIAIGY